MFSFETDMSNAKTQIRVADKQLDFSGILQRMIELSTCYIVLFGHWQLNCCTDNNIYAIDKNGDILWNIQDVLSEHLGNRKDVWYPQMNMTPEGLSVLSYHGIRYLLDPKQGQLIRKQFVK